MLNDLLVVFFRAPGHEEKRSCDETPGKPIALGGAAGESAPERIASPGLSRELFARVRAIAGRQMDAGRAVIFAAESPDESAARELHLDGFFVVDQGPGTPWARLARSARSAFAGGARRLVTVVDPDPALTSADLDAVFAALDEVDVVIMRSAADALGVVGLSRDDAAIFAEPERPMTARVLGDRVARLRLRLVELALGVQG